MEQWANTKSTLGAINSYSLKINVFILYIYTKVVQGSTIAIYDHIQWYNGLTLSQIEVPATAMVLRSTPLLIYTLFHSISKGIGQRADATF